MHGNVEANAQLLTAQEPFLVAEDVARAAGDLSGLHVIVTGANTGIGKETARVLALQGAHVVLACRNVVKAERARDEIRASVLSGGGSGTLEVMILDLSSLESVRQFAKRYTAKGYPLHVLVANAGLNIEQRAESSDGLELLGAVRFALEILTCRDMFCSVACASVCACLCLRTGPCQVNWLGHFYLATLLHPLMETSASPSRPARVVHVSSEAHSFVGVPWVGPKHIMGVRDCHVGPAYVYRTLNIYYLGCNGGM